MKKNQQTKNRKRILGFIERNMQDHVNAYAAQAAYFMILSFIPFVLFLTTMIRYTDLTYNMLSEGIRSVVPPNLQDFVMQLVSEVYNRNAAIMPVSLILALWSAGKAIQSMINGLNTVYHVSENRNWFVIRGYAVFYTILFGLALVGSFSLLVIGSHMQKMILRSFPFLEFLFIGGRSILVTVALFLIFVFLYKVLPNREASFKSQMGGALIAAVIWTVFSDLFSLFFTLFPATFNMYGSLTALIVVMMWLYFCMIFFMLGAEINCYFEKELRLARDKVRSISKKNQKK